MKQVPISKTWAEDTENKIIPTEQETASGLAFQSQIESDVTNGFINQLYEAVKYEQRTGGYYNSFIPYEINSTVKILVNENGTKSILSLLRISGNLEANRPPYTGATETDVNGVIEWSGGTFNSTYWKEIESKSLLERDKPITDTGYEIAFDSSGTVVLTNPSPTRTLLYGLWAGQEITIFNATSITINILMQDDSFMLTAERNYTKLVWDGSKWLRGVEIPIRTELLLSIDIDPIDEFGGLWSLVGNTGEYIAINKTTEESTATANLPNISGDISLEATGGAGPVFSASGAFLRTGTGSQGLTRNDGVIRATGVNFSATRSSGFYTSVNEVRPRTRYLVLWRKTGY